MKSTAGEKRRSRSPPGEDLIDQRLSGGGGAEEELRRFRGFEVLNKRSRCRRSRRTIAEVDEEECIEFLEAVTDGVEEVQKCTLDDS